MNIHPPPISGLAAALAECNTYAKGRTQYLVCGGHLPSTNVWRPQNRLPNALVEEVGGGLNNFRVRKTN